eukprot:GHVN01065838.1.p1 GENE.GHVN01065838.1~~GHVN01065838.1.p1  ORF type:complete len:475 (+),score=63.01 GHVN01065838.1:1478-2902(+)
MSEGERKNDIPSDEPAADEEPPKLQSLNQVEMKLFVGRVPLSWEADSVKPIFEEFGSVLEVAIIKDRATGNHKGSAFVRMASLTCADKAIRELNNQKTLDASLGPLSVRYAVGEAEKLGLTGEALSNQDEAKLFVGCLTKTADDQEIRDIFGPSGDVKEVFIMKDPTGESKGCAFIKFAFKEQAILAINKLNGSFIMNGAARALEVRFAVAKRSRESQPGPSQPIHQQQPSVSPHVKVSGALPYSSSINVRAMPNYAPSSPSSASNTNPRQCGYWKEYHTQDGKCYYHNEVTKVTQWERPSDFDKIAAPIAVPLPVSEESTGPPGANVFIFHVPNDWGYNELLSTFSPFGRILSARLAIDKASQRNKGFGFISYADVPSAVACVTQMNGCVVQNKRLKVAIKKGEEAHAAHLMPSAGSSNGIVGAAPHYVVTTIAPTSLPHVVAQPLPSGAQLVQPYQQFGAYGPPQSGRYSPY